MAIVAELLEDGRTHTYSDAGFRILQVDTGIVYDDAVDSVSHTYEETDELIPEEEATADEILDILLGEES